jgi:hypothetical protein
MLKKGLNIFISILLLMPLFTEVVGFPQRADSDPPSFQKPCDMDQCNPQMPKCPLCPSSGSISLYFYHGAESYLPVFTSSLAAVDINTFSDQGFVKSIFHPPTTFS